MGLELFTQGLGLVQSVIIAFGGIWVVWGLIILGTGLKDKTGPEIKQGFLTMAGGVLICLAAALITQISIG